MGAPASEDLRELERRLLVAAESGETVRRSDVQDEFQVSASEADEMLASLREHGKAVEVAPGEWRGPEFDELAGAPSQSPDPERVTVSVPEEEWSDDGGPRVVRRLASELDAVSSEPTVRLTRAIAAALDADALGKVVQAALDGLEDGETFVLEVTP